MHGVPVSFLPNHFAATESVGHDQFVVRSAAHGRKQNTFATIQADLVMIGFVAEGARHSAAARIRDVALDSRSLQQIDFSLKVQLGFVMTMAVYHRFALELGRLIALYFVLQELAQDEALAR